MASKEEYAVKLLFVEKTHRDIFHILSMLEIPTEEMEDLFCSWISNVDNLKLLYFLELVNVYLPENKFNEEECKKNISDVSNGKSFTPTLWRERTNGIGIFKINQTYLIYTELAIAFIQSIANKNVIDLINNKIDALKELWLSMEKYFMVEMLNAKYNKLPQLWKYILLNLMTKMKDMWFWRFSYSDEETAMKSYAQYLMDKITI